MNKTLSLALLCMFVASASLGADKKLWADSFLNQKAPNLVIEHVLIIDPKGIVRWEGYPLLDGFELTEKVVADILAKPSK